MNALRLMVCHKKIFKDCKIGCAWAEPKYDRRRIISTILVENHQLMLHTKQECSSHYDLSPEEVLKISF